MDSQELKDQAPIVEETKVEAPVEETAAAEVVEEAPIAEETPAAEVVEETPVEEAVEEVAEAETAAPVEEPVKVVYETKADVISRVKEIAHSDEVPQKAEIDNLKTAFYKFHIAEREAQYKDYLEKGGDPDKYEVTPSEDEEVFKAEMGLIREKRAVAFQEQEKEKQENLEKKLEIIEKIKAMATSPEEANKSYKQFKELQQQWKEIKNVPADKANVLWRNYQLYVEQFYDLLKLNNEAREYDFKKNLELKTKLCEAAERLADEPDAVSAFHQLQKLHQEFREIGPVAKDLREGIWERFKAASTVVNKRHQAHFDELKSLEEDNLQKKTALCEKVEEIAKAEVKNSSEWEKFTKEIMDIQAEWKTIGFAPQKMNVKIFERFRAACDEFFTKKAEFFKGIKEVFAANAEKKRALIAKANELKESTEWKKTSDKFIQLQKEWKEIGMTQKKVGDALWAEFLGACNYFFEKRNSSTSNQFKEERENLSKKKQVITQLKELLEKGSEEAEAMLSKLSEEFNSIGHVPFKEKDKIYTEYRETVDALRKKLNISFNKKNVEDFKNHLKKMVKDGEDTLLSERSRLMRQYESMKQEIQTYENNLGFLNASSKKGNSLIDEVSKKIDKLKDDVKAVYDKIKAIDDERNKPEEKAEETTAEE
ncbi:MAG: DUF349 domain-containing protein [Prevotellaceae bacterium]|nr:DUF349 domain-containing protein [Prevotellaceae bacterium]